MREFTNEEDNKYEESTYVNSVNLFPERQIEKTPNEKGSQATLKKISEDFEKAQIPKYLSNDQKNNL